MKARLQAAAECRADAACWAGKLGDARSAVRERAALEVGRAGGAGHAPALAGAAALRVDSEEDLPARYDALLALGWVADRAPLGATGPEVAAKLETMIAAEKGRALTASVNEDALRLATRLRRAAPRG
jgi:hypothetical protein